MGRLTLIKNLSQPTSENLDALIMGSTEDIQSFIEFRKQWFEATDTWGWLSLRGSGRIISNKKKWCLVYHL